MKKIISLLTVISLVLSMVVISAFAAWDGTTVATAFASGTGTEADPFVIATPEQLAYLAQSVKAHTTYEGKYFALGANIDLGGKEWTPIGVFYTSNTDKETYADNAPFMGSFDGKGYTISGLSITKDDFGTRLGIFGDVVTTGYIKNVVIENASVNPNTTSTGRYAGALAGCISGGTVSGILVKESVTVSGTASVGGVSGRFIGNCDAKYLVNYAAVNGTVADSSMFTGGITGVVGGGAKLSYAVNYGKVTGLGAFVGGVTGITGGDSGTGTLDNVANCGEVYYATETAKSWYIGGIAGCFGRDTGITYDNTNLYNLGKVSAHAGNTKACVGEIVGESRKGTVNVTKAYSIDIEGKDAAGKNSVAPVLNDVVNKTEAEIKVFVDAIVATINSNMVTPPAAPETTAPSAPETTAPSTPETNAPTTTPVQPSNPETGDVSAVILAAVCVTGLAAVMVVKKKER